MEILATDFELFYALAKENNIEFYFDENSVYARTTLARIGIVTENPENEEALKDFVTLFTAIKLEKSLLFDDPEYKEHE